MNTKEIWKDIPEYEEYYLVSNLGRVKSIGYGEEKYLRFCLSNGYYMVNLYKDKKCTTKRVHQLVAEVFLGHVPCGYDIVVNHINFDRLDNRVLNLELITARENTNQKHLKSSSKYVGVCWNKNNNKWVSTIYFNGENKHLGCFNCELAAAKAYQDALKSIENNTEIKVKEVVWSSKYKGVSWYKNRNKWRSTIKIKGKTYHLGYFDCELAAAKSYQDRLNSL
jgi:hypothetical protein